MNTLLNGLVIGAAFGFLLQRGRVIRFDRQIGALRLTDMTIVKFMFSSVLTAMVGVYLFKDLGMVKLLFKPAVLGENIIGGLIFGVGWAVVGYCPGTSLGALGEGRWDALWAIAGMLAGAALYAEAYPALKGAFSWGELGAVTLPDVLGVNHWVVIAGLVACGIVLFRWFEKKGL